MPVRCVFDTARQASATARPQHHWPERTPHKNLIEPIRFPFRLFVSLRLSLPVRDIFHTPLPLSSK